MSRDTFLRYPAQRMSDALFTFRAREAGALVRARARATGREWRCRKIACYAQDMIQRGFWQLADVSDERLVAGLTDLLTAEGRTEARIIAHLAELDARRLHLRRAQSLFDYCQRHLGLSDNQAYFRIAAARVARRFPAVFVLLEQRKLHLTSVALLSKYLTEGNHAELLHEAQHLSKRALLEMLARRFPRADVMSHVRKLPVRPGAVAAGPTGVLEPLSEARYCLQLSTSQSLKEKLELARDLMSHANTSGDLAVVVERALDLLITKLQKRRWGQTSRPRKTPLSTPRPMEPHTPGAPPSTTRGPNPNRKQSEPTWTAVTHHDDHLGRHLSPTSDLNRSQSVGATAPQSTQDKARTTSASNGSCEPPQNIDQPRSVCSSSPERTQNLGQPRSGGGNASERTQDLDRSDRSKSLGRTSSTLTFGQSERSSVPPSRHTAQPVHREQPRPAPRARRHLANETKRQLLARDGLCCCYVGDDGLRCTARAFLEIDHREAWAKGGSDTLGNLRVFCRAHNQLLAEDTFGKVHLRRAIAAQRQRQIEASRARRRR